jgi:hypothetical protein
MGRGHPGRTLFLASFTVFCQLHKLLAQNGKLTVNDVLERMWKEAGTINILKETIRTLSQESQSASKRRKTSPICKASIQATMSQRSGSGCSHSRILCLQHLQTLHVARKNYAYIHTYPGSEEDLIPVTL